MQIKASKEEQLSAASHLHQANPCASCLHLHNHACLRVSDPHNITDPPTNQSAIRPNQWSMPKALAQDNDRPLYSIQHHNAITTRLRTGQSPRQNTREASRTPRPCSWGSGRVKRSTVDCLPTSLVLRTTPSPPPHSPTPGSSVDPLNTPSRERDDITQVMGLYAKKRRSCDGETQDPIQQTKLCGCNKIEVSARSTRAMVKRRRRTERAAITETLASEVMRRHVSRRGPLVHHVSRILGPTSSTGPCTP